MQYLVTIKNWAPANAPFWLRGTVWTSDKDRASTYETEDAAKAALAKARQFNPKAAKAATIVCE